MEVILASPLSAFSLVQTHHRGYKVHSRRGVAMRLPEWDQRGERNEEKPAVHQCLIRHFRAIQTRSEDGFIYIRVGKQ
jgi:hypothetical protein